MKDLLWYILTVTPQCEVAVQRRLARVFGDRVSTYLPIARWQVRRRGEWREASRLLFPRYLFIGFSDEPQWLYVRETIGVQGVFAVDGVPLRIEPTLVGDLMWRCYSGEFSPDVPPKIQHGMTVVVTRGPFRGNEGNVTRMAKGDTHAAVLLELFDGAVPARIHLDDLVSVSYASMRMIG